ncbi:hypothetical protein D9599_30155 [Roseomonas sp. KE2513]|nr:hypothetical protein [Roseomonas sp. KE2513]
MNSAADLADLTVGRLLTMPVSMVREFSPEAMTVMKISAQQDIDICRKLYARFPKFGEQIAGQPSRVYMREVDMGTDRGLFPEGAGGLPLYQGVMIAAHDYRAAAYVSGRALKAVWAELPFGDPCKAVVPQWRVPRDLVPSKLVNWIGSYQTGFRDIARSTDERSLIAALIQPEVVCGHSVPTITFAGGSPPDILLWLGVANTMYIDFVVRKRLAMHLTYTLMDALPFPRDWRRTPCAEAITARAYALFACGPEMEGFRNAVTGTPGVPRGTEPVEDPGARELLTAEIEVLVARGGYGLNRDDLLFILDPDNILGPNSGVETFKALRNREQRICREYRTQRLVLDA